MRSCLVFERFLHVDFPFLLEVDPRFFLSFVFLACFPLFQLSSGLYHVRVGRFDCSCLVSMWTFQMQAFLIQIRLWRAVNSM